MNSRIDHIVVGTADLISGTKTLETKLSTKFTPVESISLWGHIISC